VHGEPNAEALIELIERIGEQALYRLTPRTGRTHQLRVQMNALGIPIVGDRIYPTLWPEPAPQAPPDWSHPLQLLAREIAFIDPVTGEPRRFISRRRLTLKADLPR
jgi:tRNA pseudouridine32 synthase/23S rRNA pseudouridine746 synthase